MFTIESGSITKNLDGEQMPYMICKKCDVYYEIADEKAEKDLKTCQCGSKMKYYEKLEDYLSTKGNGTNSLPVRRRLVNDYESSITRIVLLSLSEIPIDLGIKRFILVLQGKTSPFIIKYKLNRLKTYSLLSNFKEEPLRKIIDTVTEKNFIESQYVSEYEGSNLKLTEKGREFLNDDENIEMGFLRKII